LPLSLDPPTRRHASLTRTTGVIPPIFGLDLSPIIGFTLLNALTSATVALGAEMPGTAAGAPADARAVALQRLRRRLPWLHRA